MGQIIRQTVVQAAAPTPLRLSSGSRTVIKVFNAPISIAYQRNHFAFVVGEPALFFTIGVGESFVFDANPITGTTNPELDDLFFVFCPAGGANAVVEVWLQGQTQMR